MDIVICILPKIEPIAPTVGPAILKSHCHAAGFSCQIRDLNIELYRYLSEEDRMVWKENDKVFVDEQQWRTFYDNKCSTLFEQWAEQLLLIKPKWIGISVLSNYSKLAAVELIRLIKLYAPEQNVVVGGAATYRNIESWKSVGADAWIVGDAEESIVALLKGDMDHPGINNNTTNQLDDLDSVLVPNYDDIDFSLYEQSHYSTAYVTASRGCVRDCTFCDVATMWPRYRFRSSDNVVKEIINNRQRYGIRDFYFTDSLINGGVKNFRNLCRSLIEYRRNSGDTDWICGSQFICRSRTQFTPDDYDLMKEAGFDWVAIGVESASESVRNHMRKGFNNDDMLYTFDQCKRVGINMTLMFIVGYPTESLEDFRETLDLIRWLADNGYFKQPRPAISTVNFFEQTLFPSTPLYAMHESIGIKNHQAAGWHIPGNNFKVRIIRLMQAYQTLENYAGGKGHWMTIRIRNVLADVYRDLTGRELPNDILSYDERLEYDNTY